MFVDSHCHLSFPELQDRLPQILLEMERASVDSALCICTTIEEFPAVHRLARSDHRLWATVGVHPDSEGGAEPDEEQLTRLSMLPRVVGIGETGLDYYRLKDRLAAGGAHAQCRRRHAGHAPA